MYQLLPMEDVDEILHIDPAWRLRQSLPGSWAGAKGDAVLLARVHRYRSPFSLYKFGPPLCYSTHFHLLGHLSKLLHFVAETHSRRLEDRAVQTETDLAFLSAHLGKSLL